MVRTHTHTHTPVLALLEKWLLQVQDPNTFATGSSTFTLREALLYNLGLQFFTCLVKPCSNMRMSFHNLGPHAHELPGC
jgi:hypothetical protein